VIRRGGGGQHERAVLYKLSSLALLYPDCELLAQRGELARTVATLRGSAAGDALSRFFAWWSAQPALGLQAHYVETFDLHKRSALYLTYYSLGERRDRGMALLRLKKLYRAAGLPLEGSELPDYLPVMLEFASAAAPEHAELPLREHRAELELIRLSLREQGSPYADVLAAVCELAGRLSPAERFGLERMVGQGPPQELVGLEPFAPAEVMPATEARR
jgi:nitrate reductase delta subunit